METRFLVFAALIGCLPSVSYLVYISSKRIPRRIRHISPYEGSAQWSVLAVSLLCFGACLFLVIWNIFTPLPYYHLEKYWIIALLFLLMGVFCLQVLQFLLWESRQERPGMNVSPGAGIKGTRHVVRNYLVSNSKT